MINRPLESTSSVANWCATVSGWRYGAIRTDGAIRMRSVATAIAPIVATTSSITGRSGYARFPDSFAVCLAERSRPMQTWSENQTEW